jgi:MoaA/NifB/PqqE/SkfB family radical SAM enzyme
MYHTEIMRRIRREGLLHSIVLELTYRCNLDCFFCYNDRNLQGRLLRRADYERLLDDLAEMQVLFVTFTGGEPLLHPDFFAIGQAARERGFVIRVKSGGHCIAGRVARRLKAEVNPFQVQISLHGATAETHERQTRVPGSFEQLLKNIAYMQELDLRPTLISTLTLWNERELEQMYDLAASLGVRLTFQGPVGPRDDGDTEPLQIQPSAKGWDELRRLQRVRRAGGVDGFELSERVEPECAPQESDLYCGVGTESVLVDPYGTVYPCLHLRRAAGNLHESDIQTIWRESKVLPEALALNRRSAARKRDNEQLGVLGTPMFCPGMELRGCGSGCDSGCGSNVNERLQQTGLPNIRLV